MPGGFDKELKYLLDGSETSFASPNGPGVVVGVVADGALQGIAARGLANIEHNIPVIRETVFNVASVAKQVTALAVARLADQGLLKLDGLVTDYLTWFPFRDIRIEHLIHHTSGLRDQFLLTILSGHRSEDVITQRDEIAMVVRQQELNFAPGSQWSYSNTGYSLLGLIVNAVTGLSLRSYCAKTFFEPLGMDQTTFLDDYHDLIAHRADSYWLRPDGDYGRIALSDSTVGCGGLNTTIDDLACWAIYTMRPENRALLERPGALADGTPLSYATCVVVGEYRGRRSVAHAGRDAGFRAYLLVLPEQKLAAIVLSNFAGVDAQSLGERAIDVMLSPSATTESLEEVVSPAELANLAGRYLDDARDAVYTLQLDDGTLVLQDTPVGVPLYCKGGGRFAARSGGFEFEAMSDGIRVVSGVGLPPFCRRLPEYTGGDDKSYCGSFRSPELDTIVHVEMSDDQRLQLRQMRWGTVDLQPLQPDMFAAALRRLPGLGDNEFLVRFSADKSELRLGDPWARRVRFDRVRD